MDEQEPKPARPKRLFPPSRIILFVLLAVAICALIIDQTARQAAVAAKAKLDKALEPEAARKPVTTTRDEVHKLLDREPDADDSPNKNIEIYSWPGVLRTYRVYVVYERDQPILKDVSLGSPP